MIERVLLSSRGVDMSDSVEKESERAIQGCNGGWEIDDGPRHFPFPFLASVVPISLSY